MEPKRKGYQIPATQSPLWLPPGTRPLIYHSIDSCNIPSLTTPLTHRSHPRGSLERFQILQLEKHFPSWLHLLPLLLSQNRYCTLRERRASLEVSNSGSPTPLRACLFY